MAKLDSYTLSRTWFDFAFENPSKTKPAHSAMFFWLIELNNRNGWAKEFSSPATTCMSACGIHSYNTYITTLNDLVEFGFISIIKRSTNQYTPNVLALSNYNKPLDKALDKALSKATQKQGESTVQSTDSNIKPLNKETFKQVNSADAPTPINIPSYERAWLSCQHEFTKPTADAWKKLCLSAKWKRKELSAIETAFKKLVKYPDEFALELIENAIAGGYQGIVFSDTQEAFNKWVKNGGNGGSAKSIRMLNPQTGMSLYMSTPEYEAFMIENPKTGLQRV